MGGGRTRSLLPPGQRPAQARPVQDQLAVRLAMGLGFLARPFPCKATLLLGEFMDPGSRWVWDFLPNCFRAKPPRCRGLERFHGCNGVGVHSPMASGLVSKGSFHDFDDMHEC